MSSSPEGWVSNFRTGMKEHLRSIVHPEDPPERGEGLPLSLGRYELRRLIGEGGVAHVYAGWDRELSRPVAIKILKDGCDPHIRRRFEREARIAAGIDHPNVVRIYDAGTFCDRSYLVMELVEGRPFLELISAGTLPIDERVSVLEKIARGVAAAHDHGIVHRDLKPSNIVVPKEGEPKVTDFGLAIVLDSGLRVTRTGVAVGTPVYMAPEQVQGQGDIIGPWTDVYALGATLYETLTGRPPHLGATVMEVYQKVVSVDVTPPRTIVTEIPGALEAVCLKALRKNPRDRYPSAREFQEDLRRFLDREPVLARPLSTTTKILRGISRHRETVMVASAALLFALILWLVRGGGTREREAQRRLELARPALEEASILRYRKTQDTKAIVSRLEEAGRKIGQVVADHPDLPLAHFYLGRCRELEGKENEAERCWREAIRLQPDFSAARFSLGRLLIRRSVVERISRHSLDPEGARSESERLVLEGEGEVRKAMEGGGIDDPLLRLLASTYLAYARSDATEVHRLASEGMEEFQGRPGSEDFLILMSLIQKNVSRDLLDRAIELCPHNPLAYYCRAQHHRDRHDLLAALSDYDELLRLDPHFVVGYNNRANVLYDLGRLEQALSDLNRCLELDPRHEMAYSNRGAVKCKLPDLEGAVSDFQKAVDLDPKQSFYRIYLAVAYTRMGRSADALASFAQAELCNPRDPLIYYNRGLLFEQENDIHRALAEYGRALTLDPRYLLPRLRRTLLLFRVGNREEAARDFASLRGISPVQHEEITSMADLFAAFGEHENAVALLDRAIQWTPKAAVLWYNRGNSRKALGRSDQARKDYDQALTLDPTFCKALLNRGTISLDEDDLEAALEDIEEVIRIAPGMPEARNNRGSVLLRLNRLEEAQEEFERALALAPDSLNALFNCGQVRARLGDADGAIRFLKTCLKKAPTDWPHRDAAKELLDDLLRQVGQ